jgi:voltage-dependent potassium channel beta subunit
MLYRRLGFSGMNVSAFSLGTWRTFGISVSDSSAEKIMAEAYECGINLFDGAEVYGFTHGGHTLGMAEIVMGKALKNLKWARESYVLTGKVSPGGVARKMGIPLMQGLNRKRITDCVDATLKRYGVDYIDIFFCHRPYPGTSFEDIVISMNALIQQGKIFYWGTSEFDAADLLKLWEIAKDYKLSPPLVEQTGHNMLGRWRMERDLVPVFKNTGMGTTTFCPLRSGILTGKYLKGIPADSMAALRPSESPDLSPETTAQVAKLNDIAIELGISLTHLALAWILKNENVSTVILGTSKHGQISENVKAADALPLLTDEVMKKIEVTLDNHPLKNR